MTAFFVFRGRHSGRAKVSLKKLFQCFLRSKTLMQDSTLGPNCGTIRACPAAENLPILPPFLFPEGAVLTHAGREYPLLAPRRCRMRNSKPFSHFRPLTPIHSASSARATSTPNAEMKFSSAYQADLTLPLTTSTPADRLTVISHFRRPQPRCP